MSEVKEQPAEVDLDKLEQLVAEADTGGRNADRARWADPAVGGGRLVAVPALVRFAAARSSSASASSTIPRRAPSISASRCF